MYGNTASFIYTGWLVVYLKEGQDRRGKRKYQPVIVNVRTSGGDGGKMLTVGASALFCAIHSSVKSEPITVLMKSGPSRMVGAGKDKIAYSNRVLDLYSCS